MTEIICKICGKKSILKSYGACSKCVNKTPEALRNKRNWKLKNINQYRESERLRKQQPHNKLKSQKLRKAYYDKNKVKELLRNKQWELSNKHKRKIINQRRRAKLKDVHHFFTYDDWLNQLLKTNGYCPNCNKYVGINNLTLDHIIPISKVEKGHIYLINDIQPLCLSCNCSKKDKI